MHGAQERKFVVHADPVTLVQYYTRQINCLLCYFYERLCVEAVGRCFREDRAGQSSLSKTWIMPYCSIAMCMTSHRS